MDDIGDLFELLVGAVVIVAVVIVAFKFKDLLSPGALAQAVKQTQTTVQQTEQATAPSDSYQTAVDARQWQDQEDEQWQTAQSQGPAAVQALSDQITSGNADSVPSWPTLGDYAQRIFSGKIFTDLFGGN